MLYQDVINNGYSGLPKVKMSSVQEVTPVINLNGIYRFSE